VCRRYKEVGDVEVGDVMSDEVVTVSDEDTVEKALETMIRFEVNRLPVIDRDGKLVGVIARQDILLSICRALGGCPTQEVQFA
jgi:CBS domain-containing protein